MPATPFPIKRKMAPSPFPSVHFPKYGHYEAMNKKFLLTISGTFVKTGPESGAVSGVREHRKRPRGKMKKIIEIINLFRIASAVGLIGRYYVRGDKSTAWKKLLNLYNKYPDSIEIINTISNLYLHERKINECINMCDMALKINPYDDIALRTKLKAETILNRYKNEGEPTI